MQDPEIPPQFHHRVGVLNEEGKRWGYIQVCREVLTHGLLRRRPGPEALIVEFFRTLPPRPTDIDAGDGLGFSDSVLIGHQLRSIIGNLERGWFEGYDRPLEIQWVEGNEAEEIVKRYFDEPRS